MLDTIFQMFIQIQDPVIWIKNCKIGSSTDTYSVKLIFHKPAQFFFLKIIEQLGSLVQDPQWAPRLGCAPSVGGRIPVDNNWSVEEHNEGQLTENENFS